MEHQNPRLAVARLVRRLRLGVFWGGVLDGLAGSSLVLASLLLLLRLMGYWVGVSWLPFLPCCLLGLLWGGYRAYRFSFSAVAGAGHLDQRLGLNGLLMAAVEQGGSGWEKELQKGLLRVGAVLPGYNIRRFLLRGLVMPLFLVGVLLLPEPELPRPVDNPLLRDELANIEQTLDELHEQDLLDLAAEDELRNKLEELEDRLASGAEVEWSDIDGLNEALSRELALEKGELEHARSALAGIAGQDEERFQAALKKAAQAGITQDLGENLKAALDEADKSGLPQKSELEKLARHLSPELAEKLDRLAKAGKQAEHEHLTPAEQKELQTARAMQGLPNTISPALAEQLARLAKQAGGLDAKAMEGLQLTAEQMRQLAELMAGMAELKMLKMAGQGMLDPEKLAQLKRLLLDEYKPGGG